MSVETHPIQTAKGRGHCNTKITLRAYEVYCHVFAPQEALITGGCRGGFGVGELIAFLYAYPFPKSEWSARFKEALEGMDGL